MSNQICPVYSTPREKAVTGIVIIGVLADNKVQTVSVDASMVKLQAFSL